jgi:hypothetical protein
MYEPATEHGRGLATVLAKALELGRPVGVEDRDSVFFGPSGCRAASAWREPGPAGAGADAGARRGGGRPGRMGRTLGCGGNG